MSITHTTVNVQSLRYKTLKFNYTIINVQHCGKCTMMGYAHLLVGVLDCQKMTKVSTDIITASELLKNDVKHLQISQDGMYSLSLLSSVRGRVCWGDLELRPYSLQS